MLSIKIAAFSQILIALVCTTGASAADTRTAADKAAATAATVCPVAVEQAKKAESIETRGGAVLQRDIVWAVWQRAIKPARLCITKVNGSTKAYLIAYTLALMQNLPATPYWPEEFIYADNVRLARSALTIHPLDPDLVQLLQQYSHGENNRKGCFMPDSSA